MLSKIKTPLTYLILIVTLGFGIRYFFLNTQTQDGGKQNTDVLFAATFPDQNGQQKPLSPYKDKWVVLNFWATWCEPCREEMPELSSLHEENTNKNIVVLGIAVDDVSAINEFSKENPVSYPLFAADMQGMEIATNLGNNKGVLPFTAIIKPDGTLHKVFFGRISKDLLEKAIFPLL